MKFRHLLLTAAHVPAAGLRRTPKPSSPISSWPSASRPRSTAGQTLDIYVSYQDVSNEFAPFLKAGVERGAKEDKVNAKFIGPVGADADGQISEIETLMGTMDGLAVSSVSTDALAPVIDRVLAAGIPVVTYNTDNPDSKRLAFAGQDLVQSGVEAGKLMAKVLDGKGKVMIITIDAAAQWSIDREKGAREALEGRRGIEVVKTLNTGSDPQKIYAAIENAMLGRSRHHRHPVAGVLLDAGRRHLGRAQQHRPTRSRSSASTCSTRPSSWWPTATSRRPSTRRRKSRALRPSTCSSSSSRASRSTTSTPASASTPRRTSPKSPRSKLVDERVGRRPHAGGSPRASADDQQPSQPISSRSRGITKRFPGVLALDKVSLGFRPGEVHAVVGENGAGKSTLMNILAGDLQPTEGELRIDGKPVRFRSPLDSRAAGIVVVYQELALCPTLSVAENIMMSTSPARTPMSLVPRAEMRVEARAALARLGMAALDPDTKVSRLSVAEMQLVEIAGAIRQNARVLVLDEPNSALSPRESERLFDIVRQLRADGVTVIYVSHHLREVLGHRRPHHA